MNLLISLLRAFKFAEMEPSVSAGLKYAHAAFVGWVEAVPPFLWLTIGTLLVAVGLATLGSVGLVTLKRRRAMQSGEVTPAPSLSPPGSPFSMVFEYEPPSKLPLDSSFQMLLLCSPVSGAGHGVEIYERIVKHMLRAARIRFDVVFLERGSQAYETAAELSADCIYSAIGIIGGDKVVHEVIQGLAQSRNKDELLSMLDVLPLVLIPSGSRNGLASSLCLTDPFVAVKVFIESLVQTESPAIRLGRPVDLYSVKRVGSPLVIYDCFMTSWGVLADVNLSVERGFQWLPRQMRVWIAALKALVFLKPKRGNLTLKVQASSVAELEKKPLAEPEQKTLVLQGAFTLVGVSNVSQFSQQVVLASTARPDDGRLHVSVVRHCSRLHALRTVLAAFAGEEISDFFWIDSFVCSEVAILNESGELDICGFGEEELDPPTSGARPSDAEDASLQTYPRNTVVIKSMPRALRVFYAPAT